MKPRRTSRRRRSERAPKRKPRATPETQLIEADTEALPAEIEALPASSDSAEPARYAEEPQASGREPRPVSRHDPLGAYIREVRKTPPLSREEEEQLARRYRDLRDTDAARRLVVANLSLVVKIALLFRRAVANALDLIQEGN